MKLFLVHCGFYDDQVGGGLYENHVNYYLVAKDFSDARVKAKQLPEFKRKKMHVDGLQQIEAVDGHRIKLEFDPGLENGSEILNLKYGSRAPKVVE